MDLEDAGSRARFLIRDRDGKNEGSSKNASASARSNRRCDLCRLMAPGDGFLDLLGGCAVPQGFQRVVLVHRNHYSGFASEADDVVSVVL
jgi:hypothetical protein